MKSADHKAPTLRSEFLNKSRIKTALARRAKLAIRHRSELLSLRQADAVDATYLFGLAPKELHTFLEKTQAIPELIEKGEYRVEEFDSATFEEYGFRDRDDAVDKLRELDSAWRKEVRVFVESPRKERGMLEVRMKAVL
jgi:hypothetical protein